ncbi:MAG: two-component system response regulator [Armatimonadetes bacterium CG2_30_59_28]|nr:response regulator [Armatimonadota bacterium]OIO94954.1 MAG: two-component system response regulator [Armatimonadetes bacterium CG2_30_59_28]PIU64383.1 MAG: two-component system response regulator [Armatimonadetes bacterium CG07_land_8_20_14_0_80_59_28]PIX43156.1 MAG: two-component system response regulator [Armatimonadetes bacterium CG_4_8_14_3_um_filter_58_9]PIY39093.1 MAG: two-component system response regulator [Armatimonadetes bacterium CG_4_10_14_3_um_filter_59_10]
MKRKILVTDDEMPVVRIIKTNLELEGFQVVTAFNGEEALSQVQTEKPDLVILDVMMPKMDGWEVLARLKGDPATEDLPVVMLTALSQIEDMDRGARLGNDCYLTKPFDPTELISMVRRLLVAVEEQELY